MLKIFLWSEENDKIYDRIEMMLSVQLGVAKCFGIYQKCSLCQQYNFAITKCLDWFISLNIFCCKLHMACTTKSAFNLIFDDFLNIIKEDLNSHSL